MRHGDFNFYTNLQFFFRGDNTKPIAVNVLKTIYDGTCREPALNETLTKMLNNVSKALGPLNG